MRLKLLCVLLVLCFIYFTQVNGLKANDTGVCVVTRSVKKTQRRVYMVKYKCGKKICTTRRNKVKDYLVTQNDTVCCKGWTYSSDLDACSPLCSRGCIGGRCVAPDECRCEPPSTLDQETKNACYLPKCDPPCTNGICTANNTCICRHGYEKVDNTNCQPICEECQNGRCISPNNCECNEGYIKEDNRCQLRRCDPPCKNGLCMVNNTCKCLYGYEKVGNTCKPKCDLCENGYCTGPNQCDCYEGYAKIDGVCRPLCVNDVSVTANVCKCVGGYEDDIGCYRTCREECVVCNLNGQCRYRKVCGAGKVEVVCCNGYSWRSDKSKREFCKPICRPSCGKHGECVAYNQCKCEPPYELREGTCLLPVTCETPCINGRCTALNTCTCNTGYKPRNDSYCEPECSQSCINGICAAPGICHCLDGYTRKNQWECTPICYGCGNGECIGPYDCRCNNGYIRQGNKCVPICKGNCQYGQCFKPGECACDVGYTNDPIDKLTCRPICDPGCVNAICVAPNRCLCSLGFTPTSNASVCKPKCDYCSNGDCIGPNICKCHVGYTMIGIKCKPVCSKTCVNGFCSEPDTCTCLPGYSNNDGTDKFVCKPQCEGCQNGKCTSPGLCTCNEGYERSNGTCKPVCKQTCENGYCKSPNECGCPDGYKLNTTTKSSVCYKPCVVPCVNGICNVKGECICPYGSENGTVCRPNLNETIDCKSCEGNCTDSTCECPDGRPCELLIEAPRTGLAGLELTWILAACFGLLLFIFVIAIMAQMWRKRPNVKTTYTEANANGSVGFLTAPGTLTNRIFTENNTDEDLCDIDREHDEDREEPTSERLLHGQVIYEDERL